VKKLKVLAAALGCCSVISTIEATPYHMQAVWRTGNYHNMFAYYGVNTDDYAARNRLQQQYNQLFIGDGTDQSNEVVMYADGSDRAYIMDIASNDIRSEGMSYGMMIAVQMNDQVTFDKLTQMAQTAVCNRHHSLDQQLCRWLLLSLDRLSSSRLNMTQELIANMLGVRREGVTEAAGKLQKLGVIQYARGKIVVLDRPHLERLSCECYSVVKHETDRLLGSHSPSLAAAG
jgi:Crp-like helix-turn-helix domain/Glycosyl hydrolases family 8